MRQKICLQRTRGSWEHANCGEERIFVQGVWDLRVYFDRHLTYIHAHTHTHTQWMHIASRWIADGRWLVGDQLVQTADGLVAGRGRPGEFPDFSFLLDITRRHSLFHAAFYHFNPLNDMTGIELGDSWSFTSLVTLPTIHRAYHNPHSPLQ